MHTGSWEPSLRGRHFLRELELAGATDEVLREAGGMSWLAEFRACGEFTDAGARELRGLTGLTGLALESPWLEGRFALPEADLRTVSLAGERLGDGSFRMLGLHPGIETVRLAAEEAVGTGLWWLPPKLRTLYLRLPHLVPEHLEALVQLPHLNTLTFSGVVPTLRLVSQLVRYGGRLSKVGFLGVEQPPLEVLRPLAEAGIKVNAAAPMRRPRPGDITP
ncbi:hypothetical protein [Actinocorallia populi]|uniref:hypothetical protein n=1 Tax=Actinocorallia populi TaxID=2079200 RepID=UPI000D08CDAF|nr:hypothetical protein [Actinocorallia populi]